MFDVRRGRTLVSGADKNAFPQVSELHANFIVHDGAATAEAVAALMLQVRTRVAAASGVALIPEVEWWGDGPRPEVFQ